MSLPATPTGSWISKELKQVYGTQRFKAGKGVDLNGNGKLEKNEKIATYNTNKIPGNNKRVIGDWTDWLAFYRANYKVIHTKVGSNQKSIFFWARKFKTTNPLHIISSIESPLVKRTQVLKAYKKTWSIIARARKIPVKGSTKLKLAKAKLLAVRTAMIKSGIRVKNHYKKQLFVDNMVDGVLDCDTSSFVILAEAHEKGWPVFGVQAPQHFFVRWYDKHSRIRFNMDTVHKIRYPTDREYKKLLSIHSQAVSAGVYLKNLRLRPFIAMLTHNRGIRYETLGKRQHALRDHTETIRLNKRYSTAYFNRGIVHDKLGKRSLALKDYAEAVRLDPGDAASHYNSGLIYGVLGKYAQSIKEYKKAIKIKPKYTAAYYNSGIMYTQLNMLADAIRSYSTVIRQNRKFVPSYMNRGLLYIRTKQYTAAIRDFTKAMNLLQKSNPVYSYASDQLEDAYLKRGVKRVGAKNFTGAVSDFRKALKLNSKNSLASFLIKKYKPCIRNPRKCP